MIKSVYLKAVMAVAVSVGLSGCSEDVVSPMPSVSDGADNAIAFSGVVRTSRVATKADASLVNKNEYVLPATETSKHYVGIFGAYTGQYTWNALQTIETTAAADRTSDETTALAQYYNANFFFNQQATVTVSGSTNTLSYSPLRFWPNQPLTTDDDETEYLTFWAYYPWNATGDPGDNGVAIVADDLATGMGSVKFTMNTDAADQVDFLISDLKADCNKTGFPLVSDGDDGYDPNPVPFTFHHMLAQVRIYAFIRCTDRLVYLDEEYYAAGDTYTDAWGKSHTVTAEEAGTIQKIDEAKSVRWNRTSTLDDGDLGTGLGTKYFAEKTMSVAFNNIYTQAVFTPTVTYSASTYTTSFSSAVQGSASGTSTVNSYTPRTDWFSYKTGTDERVMLNTAHMYGTDSSSPAVAYFAPGNIMLVVPQTLTDDDVPSVSITVNGTDASDEKKSLTARVTYNMQKLGLSWESGYIYSYGFIEELMPGDDKVKGPETIIVVFDPTNNTDQW